MGRPTLLLGAAHITTAVPVFCGIVSVRQLDVATDKSSLGPHTAWGGGLWLKVLVQDKKLPMIPFHLHHIKRPSASPHSLLSQFYQQLSFHIHTDLCLSLNSQYSSHSKVLSDGNSPLSGAAYCTVLIVLSVSSR